MARPIRKVSKSGIYHVILRGVNKQRIFEQTEDYDAFYRIMKFVRTQDTFHTPTEQPNYFLYAYCIMDNHIHLLIQPNEVQELGRIMSRISTTYAQYFNKTYERVGHLFQDRFRSEVVEDEDYFKQLLSYIHNNPVKAGICLSPADYAYSSYAEYEKSMQSTILTTEQKRDQRGQTPMVSFLPLSDGLLCFPESSSRLEMEAEYHRYAEAMFKWEETKHGQKPRQKSMNLLAMSPETIRECVLYEGGEVAIGSMFQMVKQYVQGSDSKLCQHLKRKLNWLSADEKDQAVVDSLLKMTGVVTISEFQRLDKPTLRTALAIMRDSGIGDRCLSRLTGVSRGVIQRAHVYPKGVIIEE